MDTLKVGAQVKVHRLFREAECVIQVTEKNCALGQHFRVSFINILCDFKTKKGISYKKLVIPNPFFSKIFCSILRS